MLGSPIVVHLEIHNSGSKSVSLLDQLDPEFDFVKFDIKKENEKFTFIPYTILDAQPLIVSLEPCKSEKVLRSCFMVPKNGLLNHLVATKSRLHIMG